MRRRSKIILLEQSFLRSRQTAAHVAVDQVVLDRLGPLESLAVDKYLLFQSELFRLRQIAQQIALDPVLKTLGLHQSFVRASQATQLNIPAFIISGETARSMSKLVADYSNIFIAFGRD